MGGVLRRRLRPGSTAVVRGDAALPPGAAGDLGLRAVLLLHERLQPRALALAPPPATAGGGWEGVVTVRADPTAPLPHPPRPEERRVGKECVRPCRYRESPDP